MYISSVSHCRSPCSSNCRLVAQADHKKAKNEGEEYGVQKNHIVVGGAADPVLPTAQAQLVVDGATVAGEPLDLTTWYNCVVEDFVLDTLLVGVPEREGSYRVRDWVEERPSTLLMSHLRRGNTIPINM